jgi:exosortase
MTDALVHLWWRSTQRAALLSLLVILAALFPTLATFPPTWLDSRSHGFVVAAYCLALVWMRRDSLRANSERFARAVTAAAMASLLWLLAYILGVRLFHQTFAVAICLAWAVALFGRRGFEQLWPVAAIFALALPFWEVLLGPLQAMTVGVNHSLVRLTGIHATLSGTQIRFPFGTLEVAESCAGLSYFMSALTISTIYAYQFLRYKKVRMLAVLIAVGLAIVSNWIRVFGLVVIGYRTNMQSSLMAEHALYGWMIFAVVISLFFLLTSRFEAWERAAEAGESAHIGRNDEIATTAASPLRALHLAVATLVAVIGPIGYFVLSARAFSATMPEPIPGVRGHSEWIIQATDARSPQVEWWLPQMRGEQEQRRYAFASPSDSSMPIVQVVRFGYLGTAQGRELVGSGNEIAAPGKLISEHIVGPLDEQLRTVRQAVLRDRTGARLVWYWYRVADVETTSATRAKLLELVSFLKRSSPSELIAVSAPCGTSDCQSALQALHLIVIGRPVPSDAGPPSSASGT